MKVIMAGVSKTGTKSMREAFQELGMNVYDYMENYTFLGDDWIRISTKGGTTEDFKRMFKGVDAVTDGPCWYYWEEILKAFPDAKVLLTVREEDSWLRSFQHQVECFGTFWLMVMLAISPTYKRFMNYSKICGIPVYKTPPISLFGVPVIGKINEILVRKMYRKHNSYVMRTCPKDKLLVFDLKEGWEPLCEFLGVEVPSKPFPHKNKNGQVTDDLFKEDPVLMNVKREAIFSMSLLSLGLAVGGYKAYQNSLFSSATSCFCNTVKGLLPKLVLWK